MPKPKKTEDLLDADFERQMASAEQRSQQVAQEPVNVEDEEPPPAEPPPTDRVATALSKLGVTVEDLEELATPSIKPEQEQAEAYLQLMRKEQRALERLTEEEDRARFLHYLECRYCRSPGCFFAANPRGRYIIPHRRYDPKDPLMLGYFQVNKPLSMAYAGGPVPCQACGRELPFMKTPTGLVLNTRFARRVERASLAGRGS